MDNNWFQELFINEAKTALNKDGNLYASGQVGCIEPGKVYTYDGGEDAEFGEAGGFRVVRLSDGIFDLRKIKKIKCILANNGQELEFTEGDFVLRGPEDGISYIELAYGKTVLPALFAAQSGGLFGFAEPGIGYLSYVEFAETIVPIDPKFLPGVCLPVVELSQETMAGVFDSGTATCTAEEHAIIWGAYQALSPLIIKGNYNGIAFSGVSNILLDESFYPYFMANAGAMKVQVAFDDKTANIRSVQQ